MQPFNKSLAMQEKLKSSPIKTRRSTRLLRRRVMTSFQPGKLIPLNYFPLLREDGIRSGRLNYDFDMSETVETLQNAVTLRVMAHFVPYLAFSQFEGSMDQLNRSYMKQPKVDGGDVQNFFKTVTYQADPTDVLGIMGVQGVAGQQINASMINAYNIVWNHLATQRSKNIALRGQNDKSLAPAFWPFNSLKSIVPDWDQAAMDGEVQLNVASSRLPITGLGLLDPPTNPRATGTPIRETDGTVRNMAGTIINGTETGVPGLGYNKMVMEMSENDFPAIYAELQQNGITVSLSNIEAAKKTAAFARMKAKYQGIDDEWLVDLLMDGVRIPDLALTQPILLGAKSTIFGYNKRWATDAGNLDKSATDGKASVSFNIRMPPVSTGGIVIVTAQVVPEQIWERSKDYFMGTTDPEKLPSYLRDFLDPEKVVEVTNDHLDVMHSEPTGLLGYAGLNHEWNSDLANLGGKYYRNDPNSPWDEDRAGVWAVEDIDPYLTENFYVVKDLHTNVFADTVADPFEVTGRTQIAIDGNTVFGAQLVEASDLYDEVEADVDMSRIDKQPVSGPSATTLPETNEESEE